MTPPAAFARGAAMPVKPLVVLPDPLLRRVSAPVETVDARVKRLADDMLETMYDAPGIGLAAVQVGEPIRMLVVDVAGENEPKAPQVFLNPEILERSSEMSSYEEGCLSIPDYYAEVERPARVRARFLGLDGRMHEIEAAGVLATCLQHELDHLNGVLFIDHISKLKRDMVVKRFAKAARRATA